MSKSDRDQRGRPHSGKHCPEAQNGGCVYCVTGEYKQPARRSARQGQVSVITEGRREEAPSEYEQERLFGQHDFIGERCVRCNVNIYDADLPGEESCPGKQDDEPLFYSTTTGETPVASHALVERHEMEAALDESGLATWLEQPAETSC